jgi:pimeloyl-ACP methyl ester carboxylesterase
MRSVVIATAVSIAFVVALPFALRMDTRPLTEEVRKLSGGSFVGLTLGTVHYELDGPDDGALVVLMHGFSAPSFIWDETFDFLVSEGFRVLRYDLYGRGLSDRPRIDYNEEVFEEQLIELLDSLRIESPFHLVGLSMGGYVSSLFAGRNGGRVDRLVLINPLNRRIPIGPMRVPVLGEYIADIYAMRRLPNEFRSELPDPTNYGEWVRLYSDQRRYRGFRHALLSTAREIIDHDPLPAYVKLADAHIPTLIIAGEHDELTPADDSAFIRTILDAEWLLVPDAAHLAHVERPRMVHNAMLEFLRPNGQSVDSQRHAVEINDQ